jgi:hypothetical protein
MGFFCYLILSVFIYRDFCVQKSCPISGIFEVLKLPVVEQNALAKWVLEELKSEKKWERMFAEAESVLDNLADEALEGHKKGKTMPLDIERL